MKKVMLLLSIIYFLAKGNAQPAGVLYGYVYEQNSGKKPVSGVMLKAFLANQTSSNNQGSYTLTFQAAKPGLTVILSVQKEAWIIVNKTGTEVNLPEDPLHHPHTIVMCQEAAWKQQNQANRAILDSYLQQSYQKKLAGLNKQNKIYQQQLDSLQNEYTQQQKGVGELTDAMSRINLDDVSEKEKQAYELFQKGNIEACRALRETMKSESNFLKAKEKQHQIDSVKQVASTARQSNEDLSQMHRRNLREEARIAQLQFNYGKAKEKLHFLAVQDSTDFTSLFDYAFFLDEQNESEEATIYYHKALAAATTNYDRIRVKVDLSGIYINTHKFDTAITLLNEVLTDSRQSATTNPTLYEPALANALSNLGSLYNLRNEYDTAHIMFEKALLLFKKLAESNSDTYDLSLARTLMNNGNVYLSENNDTATSTAYHEALTILTPLAVKNPLLYEPYVMLLQNNLGVLHTGLKEYDAAENAYQQAYVLQKRLIHNNAATYEPELVRTQTNLGTLYIEQGKYTQAAAAFTEVIPVIRRLVVKDADRFETSLATALSEQGRMYTATKDFLRSEKSLLEALSINKKLARQDKNAYEPDVAYTKDYLATLYKAQKKYTAAAALYWEMIAVYDTFRKTSPEAYDFSFWTTVADLGEMYQQFYEPVKLEDYRTLLKTTDTVQPQHIDAETTDRLKNLKLFFADQAAAKSKILQNQKTADNSTKPL